MTEIFGVPIQALFGQLMLGLVNGSFYAMLSLGLAVIFGLLGVATSRTARCTCWAPTSPGWATTAST